MRNVFVETENVQRFQAALGALERRGAKENCLLVVDGKPGLGKTTALHRWATQTGAIYLRAKKEWKPGWFLSDLLAEFRVTPAHSYEKRFAQAMEALLSRQSAMTVQKRTFAVVLDEADHFSRNARIMETIRDFSDMGDIVFVLIGMGKIRDHLKLLPQISSRTQPAVQFEPASLEDVRRFCAAMAEVPIGECLTGFVHHVTGGYNREIVEALKVIERFGRRNGAGPDRPVTLHDMAGQVLITDRRTGSPVIVPEMH